MSHLGCNQKNDMVPFCTWPIYETIRQTHFNWKEGLLSCRAIRTKIGASISSTVLSHSSRDGDGKFILLIDSVTTNVLSLDHVCRCDHEFNDYISKRLISRSWYKVVESNNEGKEMIKSAMDNLIRTKIIHVAIAANTLEWFHSFISSTSDVIMKETLKLNE